LPRTDRSPAVPCHRPSCACVQPHYELGAAGVLSINGSLSPQDFRMHVGALLRGHVADRVNGQPQSPAGRAELRPRNFTFVYNTGALRCVRCVVVACYAAFLGALRCLVSSRRVPSSPVLCLLRACAASRP
jgi:hypothetical protein